MRPFNRLLAPNLVEKTQVLEKINFSLRALLPAPLNTHCWTASIRDQELTLVTDGSTWASQLRYLQREILKQLNAEFLLELKKCRIRIEAPRVVRERSPRRLELSSDSARTLARAADAMPDPELRAALQKLARRGRRDD